MELQQLEDIPYYERIFCNRSLNMKSINAVGFDMDYTLAVYRPETFEKLAYDETIKKLVKMGYPREMLKWKFDHKYMIRGLVIDKVRGNILKMDRHRYVKVAYHGFRELSRDERRNLYDVERVLIYEEPDFALIDTLFSLAEAFLFAQMVDYRDKSEKIQEKKFVDLYKDIRTCIDLCHRDGSIKQKVFDEPNKYIYYQPHLFPLLKSLRNAGQKTFLVTNSLWDYTHIVMNYLSNNISKKLNENWLVYFDVVITGSQKPNFFMAKNPLYEVDLKTGNLKNTDVLSFFSPSQQKPKVFQGGHFKLLYEMIDLKIGSEILYVGDHIYGDILRSKKEIGWRTMLVVEELEHEIIASQSLTNQYDLCLSLSSKRARLEEVCDKLKESDTDFPVRKIRKSQDELNKIKALEKKEIKNYQMGFHPVWGELLKTGGQQNSRFAAQVENYACLYTSKFVNLRHYGLGKNFRAVRDFMPHDLES